jgi:predicted dienelactone hydrolase
VRLKNSEIKQNLRFNSMFMRKSLISKLPLQIIGLFSLGIFTPLTISLPLNAAEKIYFIYEPIEESLNVSSLETFVADGTIDENLAFYFNIANVSEQEKAVFRELLSKKIEIEPVFLSRLLNTDEGERLLNFFGDLISIQGGRNGKFALRGALVTAAFADEGLTLLNFFKQLSVDMQIDVKKAIAFAQDVDIVVNGTEQFVKEVAQLSAQEAQQNPEIDFANLPDLSQPGGFAFEKKIWNLTDSKRNREFYVLVYQPKQWREGKTPVVIFSHGLTAKPEDYAKKAQHLASYGFMVVLPQHPGSDDIYAQEFREGYDQDISALNEFINRPLDITYTLDELERRNKTEFADRLDLENVGIYGHSYGGYTALAIAGATPAPNFAQLERDCAIELENLDTALLLECRALKLEKKSYNFRDERVKAVIASNPVNAALFGEKGMSQIKIPIAMGAGSYDPATPFIFEQVRSFPWLTAPKRYLVLEEGQAHVDISELDGGASKLLKMIPSLHLPSPELLSDYSRAMMLAFYEVYIGQNSDYLPYLNPAYAAYLSKGQEFQAFMITEASTAELVEAITKFKEENQLGTTSEKMPNEKQN